ncbi:hypothetical protein TYRP_018695 [Tyrophagus putrescentiae]|nr:hypothetical protein TYRP_018695 [Tyrophagus putrescentiae]
MRKRGSTSKLFKPSSALDAINEQLEKSTSLSAIIEQFNGQECSVLFGASDQYRDAILRADEKVEKENRTPKSLLFNIFFLYLLTQSMLTCPFYLKGSCRFNSSKAKTCKYSHGHRVIVQKIRPKSVYSIDDKVNYQKDDNCNRKLFGLA